MKSPVLYSKMQNSYAIYCHKQFASRIREACSHINVDSDGIPTNTSDYFLVSTTPPKGRRKNRSGYVLLIIMNTRQSPGVLSPFARQQISWACSLNRRIRLDLLHPTCSSIEQKEQVEDQIRMQASWNDLTEYELNHVVKQIHDQILDLDSNFFSQIQSNPSSLRVSVFPNDGTEYLCRSLQTYTYQWLHNGKKGNNSNIDSSSGTDTPIHTASDTIITAIDPNDAFSGPIAMTKSMRHAKLILHVILTSRNEVMIGISTKEQHWAQLHSKLNHHGTADITISPTDEKTGEDKMTTSAMISSNCSYIPVSRAYYKLKQVMDEYLAHHLKELQETNGSCIDVGASPGGWSQVMHDYMKIKERKQISSSSTNHCTYPVILSIDQAVLARRVRELPHVCHVREDFTSDASIEELAKYAPYSLVVCDASTNISEVLTKIVDTFNKVSFSLQCCAEAASSFSSGNSGKLLTNPSAMVITLKMPYKSPQSMKKYLNQAVDSIPKIIQSMTSWVMTTPETTNPPSLSAQYKIKHLMANSESERTLIILLGY